MDKEYKKVTQKDNYKITNNCKKSYFTVKIRLLIKKVNKICPMF
jgi:hypothetical protein